MKAVESVRVEGKRVTALLYEHLANLDVSVEGGIVDGGELIILGLAVDPPLDYVLVSFILTFTVNFLLCDFEKLSKDNGLVLNSGMVKQSHSTFVLERPYLNGIGQVTKYLL